MTDRPAAPPGAPRRAVTDAQRAAITEMLGPLPDDLLHAVRDARGHAFQRLEFVGDAVLELVVRMHAVASGAACPVCGGDADSVVTDAALAEVAQSGGLGEWLEWDASRARMADLVEACSGAVWSAHGWVALARFVDEHVHPLAPLRPDDAGTGYTGLPGDGGHRELEVFGASVLEVAAATSVYAASDAGEGVLTDERNRLYATGRVVALARERGWLDGVPVRTDHDGLARTRDVVERRLAERALAEGLDAAVTDATKLLGDEVTPERG